jgi:hypothetical protein
VTDRPYHANDLDFSDDAIDAGIAAWFRVRQVQTDRSIMRERMRAAIDAVLTTQAVEAQASAPQQLAPSWKNHG